MATPLLPVSTVAASFSWPQGQQLGEGASVTAPLIAQTPQSMTVVIPRELLVSLPDTPETVLATIPPKATKSSANGLTITSNADRVSVVVRGTNAGSAPRDEFAGERFRELRILSDTTGTSVHFAGLGPATVLGPLDRPQVDGVFTTLDPEQITAFARDGLRVDVQIENRFESGPSILKILAMVIAVVATLVALFALWCLDRLGGYRGRLRDSDDGDRHPAWRPTLPDAFVVVVMAAWTFLGSAAPDNGYILGMGRVSGNAGYLPNYFRFYGVAEAPFDWYYSFLALWSHVSTSIVWMQLPGLAAGLASWFIITRVLMPHLGPALTRNKWSLWAAGTVFTAFWLAYGSGLRTESIIVLGSLLTLWAVEKAIARRQLLPAALATTAAMFTLALAPQGVIGIAILLVAARSMLRLVIDRRREAGLVALVAPTLAAGAVVLVVVFRDQTVMTVLEAMRVRYLTGPVLPWNQEYLRYYFVTVTTPDGSLTRRIPLLLAFSALFVTVAVQLRRGRIDGIAPAPMWRIIGTVGVTLLLFIPLPMKWTIHFGVLAGMGAILAATGTLAVAQSGARSARNVTAFVAGLLFLLAFAMAGTNAWPYGYQFGIPWIDRAPSVAGVQVSTAFLALAVVAVAFTLWQHLRSDYVPNAGLSHHGAGEPDTAADKRRLGIASAPITLVALITVLVTLGFYVRAAAIRPPAMTVFSNNVKALGGDSCGMADEILAEPDPAAGLLTPVDGATPEAALRGTVSEGFTEGGIPADLSPRPLSSRPGRMHTAGSVARQLAISGGIGAGTVNGRAVPFGLDDVPLLGSAGASGTARLTTGWYELPADRDGRPLLAVAVAGAVRTYGPDGLPTFGQKFVFQFGRPGPDGAFVQVGPDVVPIDPGPVILNMPWRNLRLPMSSVPENATVLRLDLLDENLSASQFIGVTPPRAPKLVTLQELVGSDSPTLLDFPIAAHFPCQLPMQIRHGVADIPQWRIMPDFWVANAQSKTWMAASGGGLLGITESLTRGRVIPTYLNHDWYRDWGTLEKLTPLEPDAEPAVVTTSEATTWGWSRPGSIRVEPAKS